MDWFFDLISNPYLMAGTGSWFVAQVAKTIIHAVVNKKLDLERLFGDGGMPSGHSATVTAVATMAALIHGTASFEFAVSAILAIIVCHDAMGVRLETGKQAVLINELNETLALLAKREPPEEKLKEFVGHTPFQVAAGIAIGGANAAVLHWLFF